MQKRCICFFVIDEFGFLSSFVIRASSLAPAGLRQITHDTSSAKITLKTSHPASLARRRTRCRNRALHNRYAFWKASSRRCARRTDDQRRGERPEFFRPVKYYQLRGCMRCCANGKFAHSVAIFIRAGVATKFLEQLFVSDRIDRMRLFSTSTVRGAAARSPYLHKDNRPPRHL